MYLPPGATSGTASLATQNASTVTPVTLTAAAYSSTGRGAALGEAGRVIVNELRRADGGFDLAERSPAP